MDFMINEKMISHFMSYYRENFYRPGYNIIHNIIRYTAAQGLDKEESADLLCALLKGQGISREEIAELLEE